MTRRTPRRATLALLLSTGACFHFVPTPRAPAPGTPIRVALSRPVPLELTRVTANSVVEVRGEVVASRPDTLVVSVFALHGLGGFQYESPGETVALPADAVAGLEERRFSWTRTLVSGAVLTAVGYLMERSLGGAIGGGEPGGGTGPIR